MGAFCKWKNLRNKQTVTLSGSYFVDATELGRPAATYGAVPSVTGTESKAQTNELHARTRQTQE